MIILALPFSIVIAVLFFPWQGHWLLWLLVAFQLALALYLAGRTQQVGLANCLLVMGLMIAGCQWGMLAKHSLTPLPPSSGKTLYLTGKVVDVAQQYFQQTQYRVKLGCLGYTKTSCDFFASSGHIWPSYGQISVSAPNSSALKPGQTWRWQVEHKPYGDTKDQSGFDLYTWLLSHHLIGRFNVVAATTAELLHTDRLHIDQIRQQLNEFFRRQLAQDTDINASIYPVLLALISGDRSLMNEQHWQLFNRTGTTHLVAISGLHVGLVATWCVWIFGNVFRRWHWFTQRFAASHGAALFALLACTGYAALAGFGLPTQRALIMLVIYFCLLWLGKVHQLWMGLIVAFACVLVWDPVACLSIGFWLSFVAVGCILWVVGGTPIKPSWGGAWVRVQLGLFFALAPLLLWKMQAVSLSAPLANLVAIPVVGFILTPLILVWSLVWSLFGGGEGLLQLAVWCGEGLLWGLQWISGWDSSQYQVGIKPWWAMVLACIGLMWLLTPGLPARILSVFLLLPLLLPQAPAQGVIVFAGNSPRLLSVKSDHILAISNNGWPQLISAWQSDWLRHHGIGIRQQLILQDSHNLWQAKGFTLAVFSLIEGPLGQLGVKTVNYMDLCGNAASLVGQFGLQVFRDERYPRHCAVLLKQDNPGANWLLWPSSSIRSQQTLLTKLPVMEKVTVLVAPASSQKIAPGLVTWLKQSGGHLIALKPLPVSLSKELELASVPIRYLTQGNRWISSADHEAAPHYSGDTTGQK